MENFIYILIIILNIIVVLYILNKNNINTENFSNYINENKKNESWNDRLTTGALINKSTKDVPETGNLNQACESPHGMPTGMPCNYKPSYKGFPVGANEWENKVKEKAGFASNLTNLTNDCSFSSEGGLSCKSNNNTVNGWKKLGEDNGWANQWENKIMFQDTYSYKNNAYPINSFDLKNNTKYDYGWTDNDTNKYPKPSIVGVDGVKFTYN